MTRRSVPFAGESWITWSIHRKGFDSFTVLSIGDDPLTAAAGYGAGRASASRRIAARIGRRRAL